MADEPTSTSQSPPRTRRSSFAGQTFADIFGGSGRQSGSAPRNVPSNNGDAQQGQYPGPITTAAAQAQRRRMSLTTLGLSGSPTAQSPFSSMRGRRESFSSANSGSIDESAIEDEFASRDQPTTPFARRMSFGARAMRDIRSSTGGSGGGGDGSPPANGEGFNWSENLRSRAERTTSISGASGGGGGGGVGLPLGSNNHARAKSVATMEAPVREIPAQPKVSKKPDHFQERILKGDFYMD
ncbi:hypothetical protein WHR41_02951 [Cladosporium halotolerans]|uniref:Uncharacterized protein n=1 Tax=Cladosporium halotolerans TaxID=1052096 RepID=A0AB34KW17_9PEZI